MGAALAREKASSSFLAQLTNPSVAVDFKPTNIFPRRTMLT